MVELKSVSKTYFGKVHVLDKVNLTLGKGDFMYVLGGSGVGKSTLLRLLATEETPSQGTVHLFGYDLSRVSPPTLRAIRQAIGYIPQNIRLIPDMSVYDNVSLSLSLAGHRVLSTQARARMGEVLEKLGLSQKKDELISNLSGGEAQRVAVARALVRSPELIIADEPTGAQDKNYTWSLMELFSQANRQQSTVVIATHDRDIMRRVPKKCAALKGGHLFLEESHCFI